MREPIRRILDSVQLMKAMGSPTGAWDPMPPEQTLFRMNNKRAPASDRLLAWAEMHTVGYGHKLPFCCDAQTGRALWMKDIEAQFEWADSTCRHVLLECCQQGRLRVDHKARKIYYLAVITPDETITLEDEKGGEETAKILALYRAISADLPIFLNNLAESDRVTAVTRLKPHVLWRQSLESDAIAAARYAAEPYDAKVLQSIGFDKRGKGYREPTMVKPLELVVLPPSWQEEGGAESDLQDGSVQGQPTETVETKRPIRTGRAMGLYKEPKTPVQPASLLGRLQQGNKLEGTPSLPLGLPTDSWDPSSSSSSTVNVEQPSVQPSNPLVLPSPEAKTGGIFHDDVEFGRVLAQAWQKTGKPGHPNRNALAETCRTVPAEAREAYLADASPRMQRKNWHNAGALPTDAAEWMHVKWPLVREDLQRDRLASKQSDALLAANLKRQEAASAAAEKRDALWTRFLHLLPEEREPYLAGARVELKASDRWKLFTPAQQQEHIETRAAAAYCDEKEKE